MGEDFAVDVAQHLVDGALYDHVGVDRHRLDFDVAAQLIDDARLDGAAEMRFEQFHGARSRPRQHDAGRCEDGDDAGKPETQRLAGLGVGRRRLRLAPARGLLKRQHVVLGDRVEGGRLRLRLAGGPAEQAVVRHIGLHTATAAAAAERPAGQVVHVAELGGGPGGAVVDLAVEDEAHAHAITHEHDSRRSAIARAVGADQALGDHVRVIGDVAGNAEACLHGGGDGDVVCAEGRAPHHGSGLRIGHTLNGDADARHALCIDA